MKMLRPGIFVIVALLQISVPASMIWQRETTLRIGRTWNFRTEPVDPVDFMRGRYVALAFAAEERTQTESLTNRHGVYAVLAKDADGFAFVQRISETPVTGDNVVKIDVVWVSDGNQHLRFPFRSFWMDENLAPLAELAYRQNSRRGKQNAYVTVRVHNGDAAIDQLFVDGQPIAQYLRSQTTR